MFQATEKKFSDSPFGRYQMRTEAKPTIEECRKFANECFGEGNYTIEAVRR